MLNRGYRVLWSIVFRYYLSIRLIRSIICVRSYLACMIYGSDRRDLRDRERGWEVEDRKGGEDQREGQIDSPRKKVNISRKYK